MEFRNNAVLQGEKWSSSKRKEQCLAIQAKEIEEEVVVEKKVKKAKATLSRESSMMSKNKKSEQFF